MAYKHGTYQGEVVSDNSLPVELGYGYFIAGTAPIHKLSKKNRSINEVKRLGNYQEAITQFGGIEDLDFSISQAIKAAFELYGVAPLFAVNVFDPEKHRSTDKKTVQGLEPKNGKVVIENHKIITDTVVVKNNTDSLTIVDPVLTWTADGLEIFAKPSNGTKIDVEFYEVDLTKIQKEEVIGGYDTNTMQRTGLELINEVFGKYSELPAFIDIPEFSHISEVAAIMETKAKTINGGMFEAIPLINAPADKNYDEIITWKDQNNINDNDQLILYGYIGLAGKVYYPSIHYACLSMFVDSQNDGIPSQSPSNYSYKMDSLMLKDKTTGNWKQVILDKESQANFLNKNGVITAINFKGWRCWGTETALNPMATDPKDKFSYTRRMFKYIGNELVISYFNHTDKKLSTKLAETITKSINLRLSSLVGANHFIAANASLSKADNGLINVINGDVTWIINLGIMPGMKSLTFKKKYDVNALEEFAIKLG